MAEIDDFTVYEHSQDLVDPWVIQKTRHLWVPGTIFFYARKKHYLEVIKEFLISFMVSAIIWSTAAWLGAWDWFDETSLGVIAILAASVVPFSYFVFEVWRYNNEFLVLTNFGLYHRYFNLRDLDLKNVPVMWAPNSEVSIPVSYKLSGIDVGGLTVITASGRYETPHVNHPHRLHGLIPVALQFQAARDTAEEAWRL